jgi:hypothetical protein
MTTDVATHACILKVNLGEAENIEKYVYFVMGTRDNKVQAFSTMRSGLDHFEIAYKEAHHSVSPGRSAGAILNHMALRPRIFCFDGMESLKEILGGDTVYPTIINKHPAVIRQVAFKCADQERAAKMWDEATEPRMTG